MFAQRFFQTPTTVFVYILVMLATGLILDRVMLRLRHWLIPLLPQPTSSLFITRLSLSLWRGRFRRRLARVFAFVGVQFKTKCTRISARNDHENLYGTISWFTF